MSIKYHLYSKKLCSHDSSFAKRVGSFIHHFLCLFFRGLYTSVLCAKPIQLCLTLCNPMDCSPPSSSIHGILQARILEWVAMPSSRRYSQPRDWTHIFYVSYIGSRVLNTSTTWEAHLYTWDKGNLSHWVDEWERITEMKKGIKSWKSFRLKLFFNASNLQSRKHDKILCRHTHIKYIFSILKGIFSSFLYSSIRHTINVYKLNFKVLVTHTIVLFARTNFQWKQKSVCFPWFIWQ